MDKNPFKSTAPTRFTVSRTRKFAPTNTGKRRRVTQSTGPGEKRTFAPSTTRRTRRPMMYSSQFASRGAHVDTGPSELVGAAGEPVIPTETASVKVDAEGFFPTSLPFANTVEELAERIDNSVKFNAIGATGPVVPEKEEAERTVSLLETGKKKEDLRDADGVAVHLPVAHHDFVSMKAPNAAAQLLVDHRTGSWEDGLFLCQLPPVLPTRGKSVAARKADAQALAAAQKAREDRARATAGTAEQRKAASFSALSMSGVKAAAAAKEDEGPALPPSDNPAAALPAGRIGKMRVRRSGRVEIEIGGVTYEVTPGAPASCAQMLMHLDLKTHAVHAVAPLQKKMVVVPELL